MHWLSLGLRLFVS
jgi:hypothetical protein